MKHLSQDESLRIAELISTFRGPITWTDVIDLGEEVTGQRYSRVSLGEKDCIRLAYDLIRGKESGKPSGGNSKKPKSKELVLSEDRISRLMEINSMKDAIIAQLSEQFIVWAENARKHGLTEADLNRELPVIDRRRTSGRADNKRA